MLDFMMQNIGTISVGILVAAIISFAIIYILKQKKKGQTICCGSSCKSCPSSKICGK